MYFRDYLSLFIFFQIHLLTKRLVHVSDIAEEYSLTGSGLQFLQSVFGKCCNLIKFL